MKKAILDRTMFYPALVVVLLGSQVINVMNAQRSVETMENKYCLKIRKLEELTERVRKGEDVDVEKEMKLVNKTFNRSKAHFSVMGQRVASVSNDQSGQQNEDGVSDLVQLLNEAMVETSTAKKDIEQKTEEVKEVIQKDIEKIHQHMQKERELIEYKLDTDQHVLVDTPGDYNNAAKDTKVTKFL